MAENDQRSYRDPQRWRSEQEAPRAEADDPLAELARLIGQSVPTNKSVRDRKPTTPESVGQIKEIEKYISRIPG